MYSSRWCSIDGDFYGRGRLLGVLASESSVQSLPSNALTDPDPTPGQWSCTIASLGRGPVVWRLETLDYLALTGWFARRDEDVVDTSIRFNLSSSVFSDRPGGGGMLYNIGSARGRVWEASMLTPWLRDFDPTHTFHSGDRYAMVDLGWDFYNALDWRLRVDLATGYMEFSHAWYCDDKDPSNP